VRLTLPAAVAAAISSPSYAVQYLTIDAAQKLAFPSANRFVENGSLTWKAQAADRLLGLFVVGSRHRQSTSISTYAVALDPTGRVMRVEDPAIPRVLRRRSARARLACAFVGKSSSSPLKVGSDIRNISGATLSSLLSPRA